MVMVMDVRCWRQQLTRSLGVHLMGQGPGGRVGLTACLRAWPPSQAASSKPWLSAISFSSLTVSA